MCLVTYRARWLYRDMTAEPARDGSRPKADPLRYSPPPGPAGWSALPERDRRLLEWLVVAEPVTAGQAAILTYGSLRVAQRRLAKLVEYGMLRSFWAANAQRPRGRHAYRLTDAQRRDLERRIWGEQRRRRQPRGDESSMVHHLAVHDLLVGLLGAAQPEMGLLAWLPERVCEPLFDGYLRPDALAAVGVGRRLSLTFIERDTGTERLAVVLAKARRYVAVLRSQHETHPVQVAFVADTRRRAASLSAALGTFDSAAQPSFWAIAAADLLGAPWTARWLPSGGHPLPAAWQPLGPGCLAGDSDEATALDERGLGLLPMLEGLQWRSGL